MEKEKPNFNAMINTLRIIHFAMVLVLILFAVVVMLLNFSPSEFIPENPIYQFIPAGFLLVAIPASSIVFKNQIKQSIEPEMSLENKLNAFQLAHLSRMAFFDVAGILAIVVCMLTGINYNLGIILIVVIMFVILNPTTSRLTADLGLSVQERTELEN